MLPKASGPLVWVMESWEAFPISLQGALVGLAEEH